MSAKTIADLNDQLRKGLASGLTRPMLTPAVSALPSAELQRLLEQVAQFDAFTEDNDPYGEHDFGAVELQGERYFWKIDYYDGSLTYGSHDPADTELTVRVLTIMHASEY